MLASASQFEIICILNDEIFNSILNWLIKPKQTDRPSSNINIEYFFLGQTSEAVEHFAAEFQTGYEIGYYLFEIWMNQANKESTATRYTEAKKRAENRWWEVEEKWDTNSSSP